MRQIDRELRAQGRHWRTRTLSVRRAPPADTAVTDELRDRAQEVLGVDVPEETIRAAARKLSEAEAADVDAERPRTRADCASVPRPCPFVSCRYNLYLDVNPANGSIKLNHPELEPDEVADSCALDVAEAGRFAHDGITLEEVGRLLNVTRERVRQIEERALRRLAKTAEAQPLTAWLDEEPERERWRVEPGARVSVPRRPA